MIKNLTLLILSLLFFQVAKAQKEYPEHSADSAKSSKNPVYVAVERGPVFKNGGKLGFNVFLSKNIKYPKYDQDNKIAGGVIATFVVEKDGTISNIQVLRAPDKHLGDAVKDGIKLSPSWNPGIQNGQPVRVQHTIYFRFSLAND